MKRSVLLQAAPSPRGRCPHGPRTGSRTGRSHWSCRSRRAAGGNLDIVARTLAPGLGASLGQTVIVENYAGGGGTIGASSVARAKPDGYTLLVSTPNALVVSPLIVQTAYQLDSFAPVGSASTTPLAIVVPGKSRFASGQALLAEARAKPRWLTVGHTRATARPATSPSCSSSRRPGSNSTWCPTRARLRR